MHTYTSLPCGYREILSIDLKNNKKQMLFIHGLALLITVILVIPGLYRSPISSLFDLSSGFGIYALRFAALIVGLFGYIVLHELVHGIVMKAFGTKKVTYGITLTYAFAGSTDYYDRFSYVVIALAPIVLWGIVLTVLCHIVPDSWFWVVYIIQITNISGAAGDLFVTFRIARLPSDMLVRDHGVSMQIYSAK